MSERRAKRAKLDEELRRKQELLQVYLRGDATWQEEAEVGALRKVEIEDARLWSEELVKQVQEAAERSEPHAVMLRGLMLFWGAGLEKDRQAGRALLLRAHQLGSRHATLCYADLVGGNERVALMRELVAREPDYAPAIANLAHALKPSAPAESLKLWRRAAELGVPVAMWYLGISYMGGKYGAQKDLVEAARWLRRRALAKPADRPPSELLLRIQKKDAEGMVPYGEWRPAWHRWCTPEVHREILIALMLSRRRGLPRQLAVEHLLPYVCSRPRLFVLTDSMANTAEHAGMRFRMDRLERDVKASQQQVHAKLDALLELLARK